MIYIVNGCVGIGVHGVWNSLTAAQAAVEYMLEQELDIVVRGWRGSGPWEVDAGPVCNITIYPCEMNGFASVC